MLKRIRNNILAKMGQEYLKEQGVENPSRTQGLRIVRTFNNLHRRRHLDGGRRPVERKRTRAWIKKRYDHEEA